jgi:FdhE protein
MVQILMTEILMTHDVWLAEHPYLQPMADLHAVVNSTAAGITVATVNIPAWENYVDDFNAGMPLLRSSKVAIDLGRAEGMIISLAQKLASKPLPGNLAQQSQALAADLHSDEPRNDKDSLGCALAWLLDKQSFSPTQPGLLQYSGLLQYLGWTVLARYLRQLVTAFANWRQVADNEERWLRNYCPTCGSPPAMAQLVGTDPGRLRLLSCGCCATRWRYRRTQCPFCEKDDHRLPALAVEGSHLRIDYCETCGAYLKTYNGEGSEDVLLADWTSLHLDIVACDRGLKRLAGSLYQL